MSSHELHTSLIRPTVLHILRAAGFQAARPAVVDTLVDLTARYLILLGQTTASHALENRNDLIPTIADVRMALQDVGALQPQISATEEQYRGAEDMRGVEAFLAWARGDINKEIRRIAGLIPSQGCPESPFNAVASVEILTQALQNREVVALEAGEPREDFLAVLKKKHSKTGEESRYKGTVLGLPAEVKAVRIEGDQVESIQAWQEKMQKKETVAKSPSPQKAIPEAATDESSPLTDIG